MMEGYIIILSDSFDEDSDDEFASPKNWRAEAYRKQLKVNFYAKQNSFIQYVTYNSEQEFKSPQQVLENLLLHYSNVNVSSGTTSKGTHKFKCNQLAT